MLRKGKFRWDQVQLRNNQEKEGVKGSEGFCLSQQKQEGSMAVVCKCTRDISWEGKVLQWCSHEKGMNQS